jgi:Flp pilus assembly protein TadD
VALDGTRPACRLRLARRLWETEQYYQAMNEWRSVLGPEPGNIEARLGLARAAAKAGDRAAAAQEYVRILQIVPDQPEAPGSWPAWVEPRACSRGEGPHRGHAAT